MRAEHERHHATLRCFDVQPASTRPRQFLVPAALVLAAVVQGCAATDYFSGEREAKRIREVGYRAEAQVVEIWDTGWTLNNNPIVGFKLHVRPRDQESYFAETKGLISRLHVSLVQAGAIIQVAIEPEDRSKVALDIYED